ncbi:ABC transporter permease [Myroides phaeus]|uniref:ABC-2 type transport system permease protein n=1 Tax=Myroides phaeus TaxID=702745 RepID=A0A1G8ERH8_9FLAO|nr:ABC transporter permease [Myroides phaeus]SDH72498.1 ABC-2 type transport system permease protein [Myroides phaeus]
MFKGIIESFALIIEACKREFKLIFADSAIVMSYIISVLLVGFFYSYVYSHETFNDLPVAVVDKDHSSLSQQVSRMIEATPQLTIAYHTSSLDMAKELYEKEEVKGIIVIPADFGRDIQKGLMPHVSAYCDASYMLYYKQTIGAVMQALGTFNGQVEVNKMLSSGIPMEQAVATRRPFNITATPLYNINVGYATFLIPVVFIIALQTLQLTGMGILGGTMRELNQYSKTFAFANRRFGSVFLTLGRSLTYLIISMVLLLIEICVVMHIFTFPQRGNLFEIMVFLIPFILAVTFMGMALVNLFRRREDAIMTVTIFSIPTLLLSGISWPTVAFPTWAKIVSVFVPSTTGAQGFVALSQFGASLSEMKSLLIQMWAVCIFYFVLAVWTNSRFCKQEKKTDSI